ncbi:hypothetical protein T05_14369 [Trichinella murrelli]|uniref:Uncharacterized protein n=1 Tax=Trichinella murrelli TaxID=144512 RepID=A0A0V0T7C0_9BILA|nr:hypothetical protein T05_14369 [Trichinella murrelli]
MPSCQVMLPMSDGFDDRLRFFLNGGVALLRALQGSREECDSTAAIATSEASVASSKGKFSSTALTAEFSISVLICSNAALASDDTGKILVSMRANKPSTRRRAFASDGKGRSRSGCRRCGSGRIFPFSISCPRIRSFEVENEHLSVLKIRIVLNSYHDRLETFRKQVDDTLETSHTIRHSKWDAGKLVQGSVCFKSRIQFFIVRYRDLMIGAFQVDSTKDSILCNCLHEGVYFWQRNSRQRDAFCAFHPLRQRLELSTEKCLALLRHLPVVSALRFG